MLPLLGPSTVRDATGLLVDYYGNPLSYVQPSSVSWALYGVNLVNTRANLLTTVDVLSGAAIDKYSFIRNAYLQRRRFLIKGSDGGDNLPNYDESLPKYDDSATGESASPSSAAGNAGASGAAAGSSAAASESAAPAAAASGASVPIATPAPLGGPNGQSQTVPGQEYVPPPSHGVLPGIRLPH